jgi:outer membrane protein OmpA-like peptidoglycan-associated protein
LFARARRKTSLSIAACDLVRLALPALLVLAGCASRNDLYVLLPGKDGKTGALTVDSGFRQRTLDTPYASARVSPIFGVYDGGASEAEVRHVFGPVIAALPGRPVSFFLYFLQDTDEFTPGSKQLVGQILAEIARRPAPDIVVIGHTDRVGSVPYNDALSRRRAERVRDELLKLGIPKVRISIAGRGEREPLIQTEDDVSEPRNRRVEINVR